MVKVGKDLKKMIMTFKIPRISSQTREDQKFNNDDEEQEEDDDDDDDQPRWDEDALKDMDFLCTFLDNEEDNLPDIFDTKKIKKQKTENCGLCEKNLGRSALAGAITGTGSFHKRHHCRKCGTTVCSLCSQQKRRLSKVDKKKYRVCDVCDTLMSNCNFESMYDNCLKQQASTLSELKKNITKKELQIKQVNLHTDKYRKQLESKLKEISEKEQQKRSVLADKQDILEMHQKEYEEQKAKLDQMTVEIETKNKLIEELQEQRAKLKAEKKKVETQRIRKENELKDQNKKLHEVIEVDYAQSFEQNHYEQVDGILERDQYRDDDTDYEESYSVKEKLTLLDQAVGRYTTNTHDNHNGGGTRQFDHYDNESDNEDDRIRDDTVATTRYQVIGNKMQ
eukprot:403355710